MTGGNLYVEAFREIDLRCFSQNVGTISILSDVKHIFESAIRETYLQKGLDRHGFVRLLEGLLWQNPGSIYLVITPYLTLLNSLPLNYMHLGEARQYYRYLEDTMDEIPFSLHDCFRDTAQARKKKVQLCSWEVSTQIHSYLEKLLVPGSSPGTKEWEP